MSAGGIPLRAQGGAPVVGSGGNAAPVGVAPAEAQQPGAPEGVVEEGAPVVKASPGGRPNKKAKAALPSVIKKKPAARTKAGKARMAKSASAGAAKPALKTAEPLPKIPLSPITPSNP